MSSAGLYPVTAQSSGDPMHQGAEDSAVVVAFDPSGGFVTGGGWIQPDDMADVRPGGPPHAK